MTSDSILIVDHLTKKYGNGDGALTVLNDVSFSLERGTTCAVVGPSGSGKTTLLGLCAGLDRPSDGTVFLDGQRVDHLDEEQRALLRGRSIGFIFQNFQLIPTLTALENVMVPLELLGEARPRKAASDLLGKVGLDGRLHHFPFQLSGGEQQRVALARAFINRPKILFADEPMGNLDSQNSRLVTDLLFNLNEETGATLIIVTHDLDLAARTKKILRLKGGVLQGDNGAA